MVRGFFNTSDVKRILVSTNMKRMIGTGRCRQSRQACKVPAVHPRKSHATPDDHQYGPESVPHRHEKPAPDAIYIIDWQKTKLN